MEGGAISAVKVRSSMQNAENHVGKYIHLWLVRESLHKTSNRIFDEPSRSHHHEIQRFESTEILRDTNVDVPDDIQSREREIHK